MSRCASFWHKFESEGNFCGMDPTEISRVKSYLEFVAKLEKTGIEKDLIYTNFAVGAARPLISVSDDETRIKGLNYVAACLKRKEKVTAGDLKNSIKVWLNQVQKTCPLNARSENLENSKIQSEIETEIIKEPQIGDAPIVVIPPPLSDDAPMSERLKRDNLLLEMAQSTNGFQTAAEFMNGGLVNKPAPYKIVPVQLTPQQAGSRITEVVRGYLSDKDREFWESLKKSGQLGETDLEVFQGLINDASIRMSGA